MTPNPLRHVVAGVAALTFFTFVHLSSAVAQPVCKVVDPELQAKYAGGCQNGLAEGVGEASGSARYEGEFKAGRKHGIGTKTWPDGDRYTGEWKHDEPVGPPTRKMLARVHEERVRIAAVSKTGQMVCRQLWVGSVTPDWVTGTVASVSDKEITVHIDDPGKYEHTIGNVPLERGALVRDLATQWLPCKAAVR